MSKLRNKKKTTRKRNEDAEKHRKEYFDRVGVYPYENRQYTIFTGAKNLELLTKLLEDVK